MNTNIILDGFNAMLKQLIASAVADAVKPLQDRLTALEAGEWTAMEHVAAKAVQPMLNRLTSLEINQSLCITQTVADNINEVVRDVLDGYNFIKRNEVVDLVDKVVENAIDAYDFSESFDFENAIENYDFSDIMRENLPDIVDEDRVQEMINESLDNLTITRN